MLVHANTRDTADSMNPDRFASETRPTPQRPTGQGRTMDYATASIKELSKRPKNETDAERIVRLAAKAVAEGCELRRIDRTRFAVTSGTKSNEVYLVDTRNGGTCSCPATKPCKHICLCLAELGELPTPPAAIRFVHRRSAA